MLQRILIYNARIVLIEMKQSEELGLAGAKNVIFRIFNLKHLKIRTWWVNSETRFGFWAENYFRYAWICPNVCQNFRQNMNRFHDMHDVHDTLLIVKLIENRINLIWINLEAQGQCQGHQYISPAKPYKFRMENRSFLVKSR